MQAAGDPTGPLAWLGSLAKGAGTVAMNGAQMTVAMKGDLRLAGASQRGQAIESDLTSESRAIGQPEAANRHHTTQRKP